MQTYLHGKNKKKWMGKTRKIDLNLPVKIKYGNRPKEKNDDMKKNSTKRHVKTVVISHETKNEIAQRKFSLKIESQKKPIFLSTLDGHWEYSAQGRYFFSLSKRLWNSWMTNTVVWCKLQKNIQASQEILGVWLGYKQDDQDSSWRPRVGDIRPLTAEKKGCWLQPLPHNELLLLRLLWITNWKTV